MNINWKLIFQNKPNSLEKNSVETSSILDEK